VRLKQQETALFSAPAFSIFALLALAFTLTILWRLHTETANLSPKRSEKKADQPQWRQPASLTTRFPELISTNTWQFDYQATEQILLRIKKHPNGALVLNANTAKILRKAIAALPLRMDKKAISRVALLVSKSLPGYPGQQLASILTNYYYFLQASNKAHSANNSIKGKTNKEQLFRQTVLRQERYLGKDITHQLFGQQNRLTRYLYARQQVNENGTFSPAIKQQRLKTLQANFKANEQ
jgi:hypothetical protein